ncbi:ATP-binding protein [Desulfobacula toluolica]|uniref:histidine kinase n=1 Tax=Desulfobacula toluolica (strain DSM 7467 / Tol2) TaxID=651182 RepID=K0NGP2_DESTT|nr:ATP-binding protein [Desulfobacula toluolica]CCK80105.1 two component system sensor histidine kinase [Desulfobacula toluolica Tol2]
MKKITVQLSLKNRVYLVNAILLCITMVGAVLMVWYTYKIEKIFSDIIDKNIVIYQSAEALGTSLVNQKGFVSYYLLDGDPAWIDQLNKYKQLFNEHLVTVKSLVEEQWEKDSVAQIESEYDYYVNIKKKVIEFYKSGNYDKGSSLHKNVRQHFFKILELCEAFKTFHKDKISDAINTSRMESNQLRYIALLAIITVVVLSLMINYIFARHILEPIRKLAAEADLLGESNSSGNEVAALKQSVHGLIENSEQAHQQLKRSQETLMQSEKMALLGKLAAGTAHSIRNPLTSVKMRLFSLNRSCDFTNYQQEDFNVITGEIKQINKIVENFLEFSRPPKLRMKKMSPSIVVDSALRLLGQRLKSYNVSTRLIRHRPLAETFIDPEQLKEVIVNIMINACEAMNKTGLIIIQEEENYVEPLKKVVVIRIIDDGAGISQEIKKQVFNPFFTTKDDGTGLGLSIAFNIINEHGGWLDVSSEQGQGSSFIITLPIKDA